VITWTTEQAEQWNKETVANWEYLKGTDE
jgi:hypothetical protein